MQGWAAGGLLKVGHGYGSDVPVEEQIGPLVRLGEHFRGPIPWMIEAAVILSVLVGDRT
jgi:hypothetical protein